MRLIYDTEGSRVMGLGFLGLRDLVSFLRHGTPDAAAMQILSLVW